MSPGSSGAPLVLLFQYSLSRLLFLLILINCAISEEAHEIGNTNYAPPPAAACDNCTICQYPCHSTPPPPCPPAAPVACCGGGGGQYYAPPSPFYYPYNNYSGAAVTLPTSSLPLIASLYYYIQLVVFYY